MNHLKFWLKAIVLSITVLTIAVQAQQTDKLSVARTAFWTDGTTEVYLVETGSGTDNYRLLVISSQKNLKIFYHTAINSSQDVLKELIPFKTIKGRKYYNFGHHFSRTTIWMSLEFKLKDKRVDALTRTFYDGIFEVVPNSQFLKN